MICIDEAVNEETWKNNNRQSSQSYMVACLCVLWASLQLHEHLYLYTFFG